MRLFTKLYIISISISAGVWALEFSAFRKIEELAREPEAIQGTILYLADKLGFLKEGETVLICFRDHRENSIGWLMEQAVLRCGAVPVLWGEDHRWKNLLRLAFSSRATTVIGLPLIILGLSKLARHNATPLYIRNVITAGYPCLDWMIDGIRRSLDCESWGCFGPGTGAVVAGFSCGKSRGVHLRDDVYGIDIVNDAGELSASGESGEMILYPKTDPSIRCSLGENARLEREQCVCGSQTMRLLDLCPGKTTQRDLEQLGQKLHSWSSVLDCYICKGECGLELELVVFSGEKLPQLPTSAKQIIRPWCPDEDEPMWYQPKTVDM